MPPASPVPGWSSGEVWTERTATRRGTNRLNPMTPCHSSRAGPRGTHRSEQDRSRARSGQVRTVIRSKSGAVESAVLGSSDGVASPGYRQRAEAARHPGVADGHLGPTGRAAFIYETHSMTTGQLGPPTWRRVATVRKILRGLD